MLTPLASLRPHSCTAHRTTHPQPTHRDSREAAAARREGFIRVTRESLAAEVYRVHDERVRRAVRLAEEAWEAGEAGEEGERFMRAAARCRGGPHPDASRSPWSGDALACASSAHVNPRRSVLRQWVPYRGYIGLYRVIVPTGGGCDAWLLSRRRRWFALQMQGWRSTNLLLHNLLPVLAVLSQVRLG